ncbi:MAG TPA: HlyD family type I secretion periplasmic adaptor subunit [Devosiaceae bacterium]|jgi:HlyD family secretion protein|nr:HlyD family type I secretion periplasmic adaptor subunit [Devosiaceae bacterium]
MPATPDTAGRSIRRHLLVGTAAALFLVVGMGGWAATTELAGAVIAPGQLVAESSVKLVQHPLGGVVVELNVVDGDVVEAGEVLARLDDTAIRASLEIVIQSLQQLEAREARLQAELAGSDSIDFPAGLVAQASDPDVAELLAAETRLFELRRSALASQQGQLRERIEQLQEEIAGIETQIAAKEREQALLAADLVNSRSLLEQKLVAGERVGSIDRELARAEGQLGQLVSEAAQARGRIAEIELQIAQLEQTFLSEAAEELSSVQAKSAELRERRVAGESDLGKTTIRAPQSGQVHEVAINTVGGVAAAGETLMRIVPIADALSIDVSIAPQDIDQVHVGQAVLVRFSAFNLRTTPELDGTVTRLSADLTRDPQTGTAYYTARIAVDEGELERLPDLTLTSGMPVEAFIQTDERTALSYLTKPITDQIMRSFRSE